MPEKWTAVPLEAKLYANVDEANLRRSAAALENAFINEAKGHSRFPGLSLFKQLPVAGAVHLHDWRNDLIAVTSSGKVYRVDQSGNLEDCTMVVPTGGKRVIFAKSEDQLAFCAGGEIVALGKNETTLLSEDAPRATHIGYLGGYLLAIEADSQRFYHSEAGIYTQWDPIDVFAADTRPDVVNCLAVTEYGEALLGGADSIEQYEPFPSGDRPFFRRWGIGEGVSQPYTLIAGDSQVWGLNKLNEFTRFGARGTKTESTDIGLRLDTLDNLDDAFSLLVPAFGQKFIVLTAPNATNEYGTKGVSFLLDYRESRWSHLYGWDSSLGVPSRWPVESYHRLWGRHFCGGTDGQIFELSHTTFRNNSLPQRMFWRSAPYDEEARLLVSNLRVRLRRGSVHNPQSDDETPKFQVRVRRDNREWGKWQTKSLGFRGETDFYVYFGQQGIAHTFQFEYRTEANVPVDVVKMELIAERVD